jgi:hypothetical protein
LSADFGRPPGAELPTLNVGQSLQVVIGHLFDRAVRNLPPLIR